MKFASDCTALSVNLVASPASLTAFWESAEIKACSRCCASCPAELWDLICSFAAFWEAFAVDRTASADDICVVPVSCAAVAADMILSCASCGEGNAADEKNASTTWGRLLLLLPSLHTYPPFASYMHDE